VFIYYGTPDGSVFWILGDPICGGREVEGADFI